ncbi:MAG: hypothetical protein EHM68_12525 [Lysobacterales bacterium]|nr:MAG: hypothetical protein EHM68_12525 [Xanthomonadales bacterium]
MEYLYYLLAILALLALCLYLVRMPGQLRLTRKPVDLADRGRKHRLRERRKAAQEAAGHTGLPHHQTIIKRELKHVPTPWGWPGSDVRQGGLGDRLGGRGSLQAWIDHLVSEKRTVDDDVYRSRKDASLRALLEDRYGRPAKPGEVEYRRVKPPLLRDPARPYDQEDNFPSGRTGQILKGLSRQPGKSPPAQSAQGMRKAGGLKDVKTPWGW